MSKKLADCFQPLFNFIAAIVAFGALHGGLVPASAAATDSPMSQASAETTAADTRGTNADEPKTVVERLMDLLYPKDDTNLFRAFEPTQVGYTKDEGDGAFLDFTFSAMFPIYGKYQAPLESPDAPRYRFGDFTFSRFNLFFSGTFRSGQYIDTRASSPVIGKRFNPQFFVRWWSLDHRGQASSANRFVDVILYGHESNGQSISSPVRFEEQREVYRRQESNQGFEEAESRAWLGARDAISRGWDYVGLQGGWGWERDYRPTASNPRL